MMLKKDFYILMNVATAPMGVLQPVIGSVTAISLIQVGNKLYTYFEKLKSTLYALWDETLLWKPPSGRQLDMPWVKTLEPIYQ